MFTIVGKGFGLYGYLPAIILNRYKLILPHEYKFTIENRNDLKIYVEKLFWAENISQAILKADNIILAIPPEEQFKFIFKNIHLIKNKTLFLEKPIANMPKEGIELINFLDENKIKFCVNYSFLYLNWFIDLFHKIKGLDKKYSIEINWKFKAYFLKNKIISWKSAVEKGGGILNFFGIHMIAVLTALNYDDCIIKKVIKRKNKIEFLLVKINKPDIKLMIDINSKKEVFKINLFKNYRRMEVITDIDDPFKTQLVRGSNPMDRRVTVIRTFLDYKNQTYKSINFNKRVVKFWEKLQIYLKI